MSMHPFDSDCDCAACFVVVRAGLAVEVAEAKARGKLRRQQRAELWQTMIDHFEKRQLDTLWGPVSDDLWEPGEESPEVPT